MQYLHICAESIGGIQWQASQSRHIASPDACIASPRRLSLRCGHLLIGCLNYNSTCRSTRGRTFPRRQPLEWFLFVSLCYLYCTDFYGHIQKLVCTICGVLVVVDERYPSLFEFALDVTMYIACNAECAIYDVCDDYFDIYALLQ